MFLQEDGFVKWVVLSLLVSFALSIALGWPRYQKSRTIQLAKKALERGKEIAYFQESFKARYGMYMPDLSRLDISFTCQPVEGSGALSCDEYIYEMEQNILKVRHRVRPSWFEVHIEEGWVDCFYAEKIVQESRLCRPDKMPELL